MTTSSISTSDRLTLETMTAYRVAPEQFWEAVRFAGDGYDRTTLAAKLGWVARYNWGRDGWDLLDPPYYIAYTRDTRDGYELATNCEGDVTVYCFPDEALRTQAIDALALWFWQQHPSRCPLLAASDDGTVPDALRGPWRLRTP